MVASLPPLALAVTCAACLLCWPTPSETVQMEVQLERLEQIGGEHLLDSSGTRIRKYNRTVAIADGTFSLLEDIDDSYEGTIRVAHSALGNNQFNEYPMKIPRKKACQAVVEDYAEYQHHWANNTNFPQVQKGVKLCPIPKGEYWVKNFAPDASWVPQVVPEGFWRMTLETWGPDGEPAGQLRVYMRLKKGYI